ncbi:hypothetical protein BKA70DRAFT_1115267, partial [Coprinopsis sp. MPI-PUGE-AT-0042]
VNYYDVLCVSPEVSLPELKAAYHRALLQHHPDKQHQQQTANRRATSQDSVEIALIKEAFAVLSSAEDREKHDAELKRRGYAHAPRPAQVISLEDWAHDESGSEEEGPWMYHCRCGGLYWLTMDMMERDEHLIGCNCCSEAIWAGYELEL